MLHNLKYLLCLLLFTSCFERGKKRSVSSETPEADTTIRYAKRFSIARINGHKIVYLFGNRHNRDTTATFFLTENGQDSIARSNRINVPCQKIAALSSIYAAMICELGASGSLAAIDNIDYVNNPTVIELYNNGKLKELARTPEINLEPAIALNPGIIFYYGMGDNDNEKDRRLKETGIPVAICVDHLEEHPLARAEWIKFFAAFVNKEEKADSIFSAVEKNYLTFTKLTASVHDSAKPTVFSEVKLGDVWYMPGGRSFMGTLLKDAGADYLWKDNENFGSLPLTFEQVYARAVNADCWINLPLIRSKKELSAAEERYSSFKAFKSGNLYNNTKDSNRNGYSAYWETGMIYPDRILSDLVKIFHPDLINENEKLFYYEKLK